MSCIFSNVGIQNIYYFKETKLMHNVILSFTNLPFWVPKLQQDLVICQNLSSYLSKKLCIKNKTKLLLPNRLV